MKHRSDQKPEHRNSVGYVISDGEVASGFGQAMIVWGRRADGTRVSIKDAMRGGSERLKCECGADLVARKGEIYAHHFAHASGGGRVCRHAQTSALCSFASGVLSASEGLVLPVLRGRHRTIEIEEISERAFGECAGLVIASAKGVKRREMAVLLALKRRQSLPSMEDFAVRSLSAIAIDLFPYRNQPDDIIAQAIIRGAKRRWINNDRYPEAVAEQDRGHCPSASGTPSARRLPSNIRSGYVPLISEEEWKTLSPVELRRRLFGNKYDR
jgi:hypothetical protein